MSAKSHKNLYKTGVNIIITIFCTFILTTLIAFSVPAANESKLTLLSPHQENIQKEFTTAFKKWYKVKYKANVDLVWLDQGGTSNIIKFIDSEFKRTPDGINVDILFGGGIDPYLKFKKEGDLMPYKLPAEILSKIPGSYSGSAVYDPDFQWYSACFSGFGIIYNKQLFNMLGLPIPTKWSDLAKPELAKWVSSSDPRQSGSIHQMYEIILQSYGWEEGFDVITRLNANVKIFGRGASDIPRDVDLGETACGLAIDIYALAKIAESTPDKLGYVMPEGETVISGDAIAILKGAPHKDIAQSFVEFVMSEDGQKLWMTKAGLPGGPEKSTLRRMSVMPHLYDVLGDKADVPTNPFNWKTTLKFDDSKSAARQGVINDLIGAMTIDVHDDLAKAWEAVRKGGMNDAALKRLVAVPITEAEALNLGKGKWENQEFRNAKISEWTKFAKDKYRIPASSRIKFIVVTVSIVVLVVIGLAIGGLVIGLRKRQKQAK
jgi:ABC-type Fe3+ transport system substrate-binding protein